MTEMHSILSFCIEFPLKSLWDNQCQQSLCLISCSTRNKRYLLLLLSNCLTGSKCENCFITVWGESWVKWPTQLLSQIQMVSLISYTGWGFIDPRDLPLSHFEKEPIIPGLRNESL
jgi:hypothetical protein